MADLRERVARAIAGAYGDPEGMWKRWLPEADAVLAELKLTQAEPVAFTAPRDIRLGETIYTPPGEEVRFCYTRGQPDNVNAWRLGESCRRAADSPAGDYIDRGLSLLKELEARGYGVFRFVKDAAPQPQSQPQPQPQPYHWDGVNPPVPIAPQPQPQASAEDVDSLLAKVPLPPNTITFDKGWELLDELQALAVKRASLGVGRE